MQALLVIDVQRACFELPVPLHDPDATLARIGALIERARAARAPIVYARQLGGDGSQFAAGAPGRELHPALAPRPDELVLDKREPDAFHGTALAARLAERGVDEVVICGFATEACVDTTVRSAFGRGLRVVLAAGAHTTTANAVLTAEQVVRHHELVLARFARVIPADEVTFARG